MAKSSDLMKFIEEHYPKETLDANKILTNGISELNEKTERALEERLNKIKSDIDLIASGMTRKVDHCVNTFKSDTSIIATKMNNTIDSGMDKVLKDITLLANKINTDITEMREQSKRAENSAKIASWTAMVSFSGFIALLLFIFIGS